MRRLVLLVLGVAACQPPKPPVATYDGKASLAPVATSTVHVLTPLELPDGFHLERQDLYADPGVPSPATPHRVLGRIRVVRDKRHQRDAYLAVMQAEAAKHGANALVLVDEAGTECVDEYGHYCRLGWAVALSDAPVATFPAAREVLADWRKAHPAAGRAQGEPRVVELSAPTGFEIVPHRGECLTFVLALDTDGRPARLRDRTFLSLQTKSPYLGFNRREGSRDTFGTTERAIALDAGCAQGADPVAFAFRNTFDGNTEPPGHGKAVVQVFVRTVDGKTLERQAKELADADRRAREANAEMQQEACDKCIGEWRRCVIADPDIEKGRCERFNRCVQRRYASPTACDVR